MYKCELFNQQLQPVDIVPISDRSAVVDDYLTLANYSITVPKIVEAKAGYFVHITDLANNTVIDSLIRSVTYDKGITELSCSSLLALFDVESANVNDAGSLTGTPINIVKTEKWLTAACNRLLTLLDVPHLVTYTTETNGVTRYNGDAVANIYDVISLARKSQKLDTKIFIDLNPLRLRVIFGVNSQRLYINSDLNNVINREINVPSDNGAANICNGVLYKQSDDGIVTETAQVTYYRHADGTVDTSAVNLITPHSVILSMLQYDEQKTEAENLQALFELAREALYVGLYDNEISLTYNIHDRIINFDYVSTAVEAEIVANGESYISILQGWERTGDIVRFMFGNIRTDLTSILTLERRSKK